VAVTGASKLFVRNSTGLVREASAFDATIFNAAISAPVGSTIAYSVFFTLAAFPGADVIGVLALTVVLNIPILIMFALMAASMPRVGGDYVWVSRILSPPLGLISNVAMIFGGLAGAAFFAKFFSVFALGPVLSSLGILASNSTLTDWGTAFQSNQLWILVASLAIVALQAGILIRGTKSTFRWQNGFFIIAMAGTLLAFLVLLVGNQTDFFTHFNTLNQQFGGGTVQDVIAGANAQNAAPDLGNLSATLPTLFSIEGFMMWNFWSVYMSGELKSASNRGRQMKIMFGGLLWDGLLLILGVWLLFRIAGYNFVYALNAASPAYAIPTNPFYHFLAALVFNTPIVTLLIVGSFMFWSLPSMIANTYMPIRSFFAWSFDRLIPEKLSEVNERYHSPIPAILLATAIIVLFVFWSVFSSSFQIILGMIVLAGILAVCIVAVAAIAFPTRRPDLYKASPANLNFLGIPVLYITGAFSIVFFLGLLVVATQYPALVMAGDPSNAWWIPAFFASMIVIGLALYYIPRMVRKSQGIDIDFVYKELPPE
jgi:basic amino acid/polyamine antiporter, APA family